jgi:hypothetical protein
VDAEGRSFASSLSSRTYGTSSASDSSTVRGPRMPDQGTRIYPDARNIRYDAPLGPCLKMVSSRRRTVTDHASPLAIRHTKISYHTPLTTEVTLVVRTRSRVTLVDLAARRQHDLVEANHPGLPQSPNAFSQP